jgi:hypothetical protein
MFICPSDNFVNPGHYAYQPIDFCNCSHLRNVFDKSNSRGDWLWGTPKSGVPLWVILGERAEARDPGIKAGAVNCCSISFYILLLKLYTNIYDVIQKTTQNDDHGNCLCLTHPCCQLTASGHSLSVNHSFYLLPEKLLSH